MSNRTTEQQIEDLNRQLELLVVQQDDVNARVIDTRNRVEILTTTLRGEHTTRQEEITTVVTAERAQQRTEAVLGSGYCIGDQVDIRHPREGQESSGVVIGRTKDQLLKVQTASGNVIRRLPKNVRLS